MPCRPATFWDLVPSARILAAAFKDEPLLGPIIHPHRKRYPNDMYLFFLRGMRTAFYSGPDHVHLLTYDTAPTGKQQITGYAHWIRKVISIYNYFESFFLPNRAIDPLKAGVLVELDPLMQHHLQGPREECWYLSLLGVDPTVHKSGQGRQLVSWGVEHAKAENIPASLVASGAAAGFYRKCGFNVELGRIGDVKSPNNPFVDVEGGEVMFTK